MSNRWPFTVFNAMLNIATVNAQIIFKSNTNVFSSRRSFISNLSRQLTLPHLVRRASLTSLSFNLRQKINFIAKIDTRKDISKNPLPGNSWANTEKGPKCGYCPNRKNRFTKHRCNTCNIPICKEHTTKTVFICHRLVEDSNETSE